MLSFKQFLLSLLQHAGQSAVLPANILDSFLHEVDEEGLVRGLRGAFLEMGGFFGDELRNFSPAVVAGGHDVLELL